MRFLHKYLLLIVLSTSVFYCTNPKGPIFLEDPLPAVLTDKEKRCVELLPDVHRDLDLVSASQDIARSKQFAQLIIALNELDKNAYLSISRTGNGQFTLLMPSDEAWENFYELYDPSTIKGDTLAKLIKQHILIERFAFRDIIRGVSTASTMNEESVEFVMNQGDCMTVNGEAIFIQVEDVCRNGLIHVIDQVLIPDDGY